jgi:DNA-directed RNA polymerase specialized sigma24 family protein
MDAEAGARHIPCSPDEVGDFFDRMTSGQKRDAYLFAVKCAASCLADAHELVNEAFVRMWEGRRKRRADNDDLFPVLLGTIRSLASDRQFVAEAVRIRRMGSGKDKGKFGVIERDAAYGSVATDEASAYVDDAIERMDPDVYREALLAEIEGDAELQLLFEGLSAGFIGSELAELMDMDAAALATVRRRFKRRMLELGQKLAAREC